MELRDKRIWWQLAASGLVELSLPQQHLWGTWGTGLGCQGVWSQSLYPIALFPAGV